jgi:hypothetical protein
MKRKVNKKNYTEDESFGRKPKKGQVKKDRSSKRRLSIYDDFEDGEPDDSSFSKNDDLDEDENEEDIND